MVKTYIDYTKLLPENLDTEFYHTLLDAFSQVANGVIHPARETLANLRAPDVEPLYASLNAQMLGLKVPIILFTDEEYARLMRWLGMFVQTRGASTQFINFISFIKNVPIIFIPLWADDLTDINSLTDSPGTSILDSGTFFPTPFYDAYYSIELAPNVTTDQIKTLLTAIQPIHLVLRNVVPIEQYTTEDMVVPVALEFIHDASAAAAV